MGQIIAAMSVERRSAPPTILVVTVLIATEATIQTNVMIIVEYIIPNFFKKSLSICLFPYEIFYNNRNEIVKFGKTGCLLYGYLDDSRIVFNNNSFQ